MTRLPDDPARARAARRRFLALSSGAGLALSPLGRLLAAAGDAPPAPGYGPLRPVRDLTTNLPLLELPDGFSYRSFGWTGEALADDTATPGAHDGMGVVRQRGDIVTLVRNHEVVLANGAYGPDASHYDPACSGGTVTLDFDVARGQLLRAWPSLSGTLQNCAGGITPWQTWLSCEELVSRADRPVLTKDGEAVLRRDHGFVFEVPADGHSRAEPLVDCGQFKHEAATVHRPTGDVYLTEDAHDHAGFYRLRPRVPGELARGGRLQMLKVKGRENLTTGLRAGQRFATDWVDIDAPAAGVTADGEPRGVQRQGFAQGAAHFTRLEGCIATADEIFFTATDGGDAQSGQLFAYLPGSGELLLVYESPNPVEMHYPDNIVLGPRGGLVLCQDSPSATQQVLWGMGRDGRGLFELARNAVVLDGGRALPGADGRRFAGDYRAAEWAGACFSQDGKWLFANVYTPGFSVAITGPWERAPL